MRLTGDGRRENLPKLCIKHEGLRVPGSVEFPFQTAWPPRLPVLVGEDAEKEVCSSDSGYFIGSGCMRPGGPAKSM